MRRCSSINYRATLVIVRMLADSVTYGELCVVFLGKSLNANFLTGILLCIVWNVSRRVCFTTAYTREKQIKGHGRLQSVSTNVGTYNENVYDVVPRAR